MEIVLQIAGLVFLIIILGGLFVGFRLWRKWKRFKESLTGVAATTPSEIHLDEDASPEWLQKEAVQTMVGRLTKYGFAQGRAFTIEEMPAVRLVGLFHPKTGAVSVVYDHDSVGNWLDLCVKYQDGRELTVTSAPRGEEIDHRPECQKVYLVGASVDELIKELKNNFEKKPLVKFSEENFRREFEESYAKTMQWRNERGGTTMDEVKRVSEIHGPKLDEEGLRAGFKQIKEQELNRLHEECLEQFMKETDIRVAQWKQYENAGGFMIFHDKVDPSALADYIGNHLNLLNQEQEEIKKMAADNISAGDLFTKALSFLSPAAQPQKIGSVTIPLAADIYFVPDK